MIFAFSKTQEATTYVYKSSGAPEFKDGRVLGAQGESIYEGKERLFSRTVKDIQSTQAVLRETTSKLQARLEELEKTKAAPQASPSPGAASAALPGDSGKEGLLGRDEIRVSQAAGELSVTRGDSYSSGSGSRSFGGSRREAGGNSIISFPVKEVPLDQVAGIVVPAGSYVKAMLMTGVEAPEGKTYPVLLQLDYAYIVPNKHRVDLSGCFMIAKSQGDLSTERVQMQANKLSCVSKEGRMFEREVNGFIADDKDNSFAVMGSVNSKQDRVAAMAFLSSVVKGVGSALQQAQSSTQMSSSLGGQASATNVSGSQAAYIAGGGASEAASMVTQWYLKQAQNLLPTINIGSGQDVWVIMQDTVKLPNDYFRKNVKGGAHESVYTYFSRVAD
jgi:conjugal transfer pilus assembly protein TraB